MSWLSNALGIHLGNIGAPIGAAIGSIVPGVGTAIGAGLGGALGSLGQGKSVGQSVLNGAETYGAGKLAGAIPGLSGVLGSVASGAGGVLSNALGGLTGGGSSSGGGINPAILALVAAQTANAANLGKTANDYSDKAWNLANDSYTSRAGLRDLGIKGLTNNAAPDLSSLSAIRAQNPVAAKAGVSGAPGQPPTVPPAGGGLQLAPPPTRTDATPSIPAIGMRELPPELSTPVTGDIPSRSFGSGAATDLGGRFSNTQGLRSALRPNVNRIPSGSVMAA